VLPRWTAGEVFFLDIPFYRTFREADFAGLGSPSRQRSKNSLSNIVAMKNLNLRNNLIDDI
jgi:hypothetical protein